MVAARNEEVFQDTEDQVNDYLMRRCKSQQVLSKHSLLENSPTLGTSIRSDSARRDRDAWLTFTGAVEVQKDIVLSFRTSGSAPRRSKQRVLLSEK
ncbi:hypothetical protein NliqN6_0837 [Naganishia liquefaciens]|uniref:Uncharacterized protein n=1 Tax=Naganishia liquefaciens TaxID=104408 RepID=A0A8H3TPZ1_9TREE|nr:hypothetical protein NliqN6_0837 [Naganishia liquefaciens]